MHDDEFTPRLGRMRGKAGEPRYLSQVMKAAARAGKRGPGTGRRGSFDGSRIGRGASVARVLGFHDRLAGFRARDRGG